MFLKYCLGRISLKDGNQLFWKLFWRKRNRKRALAVTWREGSLLTRRLARLGVSSWETSTVESPSCASQDGWPRREEKCSSAYMEAVIKELTREKEEGKICLGIAHHQNGTAGRGHRATGGRLNGATQKKGIMIINTNKNIPPKTCAVCRLSVCLSSGGLAQLVKFLP